MRGRYTEEQQQADIDLGKSITPGCRNIAQEGRVYGCPSIRNDIPKLSIARRSVADSQNYGDDATAAELINPHKFANLAIDASAMEQLRSKQSILNIFKKIGYGDIPEDIIDEIYDEAVRRVSGPENNNMTTVSLFRDVLNEYLIAMQ